MNKANIILDLKNILGPGIDVDDTGLLRWVNDAYMYMIDEITKANPDYFVASASADTLAEQFQYDVPDDYEKMVMVNLRQNGVWRRVLPLANVSATSVLADPSNFAQFTAGDPRYYLYGTQIGLLPIPDDSDGELKIWYVYTPTELINDTDVPAFPKKYHHIIKLGAQANYLDRDNDHNAAELMRRRFEARVADMVEMINEMQVDEPKSILITTNQDAYYDNDSII